MKQEVLDLWIAELESGNYEQATTVLIDNLGDGKVGYCCLGVLCEIAVKNEVIPPRGEDEFFFTEDDDHYLHVPGDKVISWAELGLSNPYFKIPVDHPLMEGVNFGDWIIDGQDENFFYLQAATLNDHINLTFPEIAQLLKEGYLIGDLNNELA